MAIGSYLITALGILSIPMTLIACLVLTLAAMNKSLGIRRLYVNILGRLFIYATKIKNDKELSVEKKNEHDDRSNENEPSTDLSIIERSPDDPIPITSPGATLLNDAQKDEDEKRVRDDLQFDLSKIMNYTRQGLEAIVDDEVTKRFSSAEEMAVWNLLTRTQQQHGSFSLRVSSLWFIGFLVRYCLLFPFRLFLFILAVTWMLCSALLLKYFLGKDAKLRHGYYINLVLHRILSRVFSAIISFHNTEYRAQCGSICVANHTSPIDVIILSTDNSFSMIGQQHGGFFGMVQRTLSETANHIWFERSEAKDRHMVTEQMREHLRVKNNLPILIFPEGTCINNTSVMMFKKGCFEITEATVYPVAIKYDNRFGDAFWNSSKHELFQYLILMMTSWAIVVDVYYLPPMSIQENETPIDFARRVKSAIAKQGGFVDLEWDGGLKRSLPKADYKAEKQRKFVETLKSE